MQLDVKHTPFPDKLTHDGNDVIDPLIQRAICPRLLKQCVTNDGVALDLAPAHRGEAYPPLELRQVAQKQIRRDKPEHRPPVCDCVDDGDT